MTSEVTTAAPGFWYGEDSRVDAVDVLNALRRYRTAESSAQRRVREELGIGENALMALRVLVDAETSGRTVNSKELAERLGITAASTSALVDRLVRSGHVERHADPADRRGVILTATGRSMRRALAVIGDLDSRAVEVAQHLPPEDMAVVVAFLREMAGAVDESADHDEH
ncbi:MarR family transcriptional regulator [Curtobacterium sp. MCJR17_055]|uniref:MarR family winged helix-turn-helix transcriptional regulator n=1 Tax=unclassified Curtobacterium TaxID=257496 RepID=UPI000D924D25|nr:MULTISPECIES: MarR family transcriptional regulator [unclassified Curtobacterium]PYY36785.1 MarR family transcriptional regulator [Curtobacterium sp. MCBD17_029]PYY58103.1 MarR family transcriptional regulator [Curtobacterium sp. MCPF17_015]PYY58554.1 MarR family transcriptional regulator [Curtobacterium sp. MCJR17_055]